MDSGLNKTSDSHIAILSTFGVSFFIWGLLTVLNFVFIEHLRHIFHLSYSISTLIHLTFFSTYLIVSLPAGRLIKNWGYKLGLIIGLFTTGLGCMLFYFAIYLREYYFFLLALAVQATGITLLQVGANLYIVFFGNNDRAPSRLTMMQGLNALGAFLAPIYGMQFFQQLFGLTEVSSTNIDYADVAMYVQTPYIILSIVMYILTIFFVFVDIPEFNTSGIKPLNIRQTARRVHVMHFKQLRLGAFAIFAYLGAEVAIGSLLLNFFSEYTSYYWGAALAGRVIGALLLLKISPRKALAYCSAISAILLLCSILTFGMFSIWSMIAIGLFNSIMFPTLYVLGITGLGKFSENGSAIMIMAFVGAGVIPFNALNFASHFGYRVGFIFPLICYIYILYYALEGSKFKVRDLKPLPWPNKLKATNFASLKYTGNNFTENYTFGKY